MRIHTDDDEGYQWREITAYASFLKPGNRVDYNVASDHALPGFVSVNGVALTPPSPDDYSFYGRLADSLLAPPGKHNYWRVSDTGFAVLPPLFDSIQTPSAFLRIVAPTSTDSLSLASGFEIRVEGSADSLNPMVLQLYQVHDIETGEIDSYVTVLRTTAPVSITPQLLRDNGIGVGELRIRAARETEQRYEISSQIRSILSFSEEYTVITTLKD